MDVGIFSLSLTTTATMAPFSMTRSVTLAPKRTSPPQSIICWRMAFTMPRSISVPTCGLCLYKISSGAPKFTKY